MNDQFERAAVTPPNGSKVTHFPRDQTTDAERLSQRHDRSIDEAEAEIREASIHFHRASESVLDRCVTEATMIWRTFDKRVVYMAGIAKDRGSATRRH